MNLLRRHVVPVGLPVAYADAVSEDQVRKIDEIVESEFSDDGWVTVEEEL